MSIDKGDGSQVGKYTAILANAGIGSDSSAYEPIQRNSSYNPAPTTTDSNGDLWILVGADSGF